MCTAELPCHRFSVFSYVGLRPTAETSPRFPRTTPILWPFLSVILSLCFFPLLFPSVTICDHFFLCSFLPFFLAFFLWPFLSVILSFCDPFFLWLFLSVTLSSRCSFLLWPLLSVLLSFFLLLFLWPFLSVTLSFCDHFFLCSFLSFFLLLFLLVTFLSVIQYFFLRSVHFCYSSFLLLFLSNRHVLQVLFESPSLWSFATMYYIQNFKCRIMNRYE